MSIHDEIGDLSGSQIHLWPSQRTDEIVENFKFPEVRSELTLDRDVSLLEPEVRAAEIARNLYADEDAEFGTSAMTLAAIRARTIASLIDPPFNENDPKELVGFTGQKHFLVQWAQELAWLSFAFDFGATPADLLAWGVDEFVVIQLIWWELEPGETRLLQHIRALRNGWALPALSLSVRDAYGNLIRFADKGAIPDEMLSHYADDFKEVRELLSFFDKQAPQLSASEVRSWARAFAADVRKIAPDAKGRWGMLPAQSLKNGELRWPTNEIARYLQNTNVKPAEFKNLPEDFFGRVGDGV